MQKEILKTLGQIEVQHNVKILYACESGSRAWGFPSPDSDYDVRYLYLRPLESYLKLFAERDVIEGPIDEVKDFVGWDLQKALKLLMKGNAPLIEWLHSPIVYRDNLWLRENLTKLFNTFCCSCIHLLTVSYVCNNGDDLCVIFFSQFFNNNSNFDALYRGYFGLAMNNFKAYLTGETVKPKKYLYVLRSILACEWIKKKNSIPPVLFRELYEELLLPTAPIYSELEKLLKIKVEDKERSAGAHFPVVDKFIDDFFKESKQQFFSSKDPVNADEYDKFFLECLRREN
jgi:predicted nucleotidyltransferase